MRPTPIPEHAVWYGATRAVFAAPNGDLTDPDIAPVEVVVDRDGNGDPRYSIRAMLEPGDLEVLAAGGHVWLTMWGAVVPFAVNVHPDTAGEAAQLAATPDGG